MLRTSNCLLKSWRLSAHKSKCFFGSLLKVADEVKYALRSNKPVVALESTIISHGMPYPRNVEVAKELETVVRANGAIPATIAVIKGIPTVGLTNRELLQLADPSLNRGSPVLKASTRDLAYACSAKRTAATTVASTMKLAHLSGISVFATGGIGGVHRGAEVDMDVSADLLELSRTPVTVVCAGIKSILDVRKSLEVLETNGVPVLGFQLDSNQFPAFFTNQSGVECPRQVQAARDVASIMLHQELLQLPAGIVLAVPNPQPADPLEIHAAIDAALALAAEQGISGAAMTPFLLEQVQRLSGGRSLEANCALVLRNAQVASQVAVEHAALRKTSRFAALGGLRATAEVALGVEEFEQEMQMFGAMDETVLTHSTTESHSTLFAPPTSKVPLSDTGTDAAKVLIMEREIREEISVLVVGGAVVDTIGRVSNAILTRSRSSNPGQVTTTCGGVGRNIAERLVCLRPELRVSMASVVANDAGGQLLLTGLRALDIDVSPILTLESATEKEDEAGFRDISLARTATYNAIHDSAGDLVIGVADMDILSQLDVPFVQSLESHVARAALVVIDANLPETGFRALVDLCVGQGVPVFFEPTSDHKCLLPLRANRLGYLNVVKPNLSELVEMVSFCLQQGLVDHGRALVGNTLSRVVAARVEQKDMSLCLDLVDIRILACALLQVMRAQIPKRVITTAASEPLLTGHHVIVSMGAQGALWAGPLEIVRNSTRRHDSARVNGGVQGQTSGQKELVVVVDELSGIGSVHLPALPLTDQQETNVTTVRRDSMARESHFNGAGDAFCAGIISTCVSKGNADRAGSMRPGLPDLECVLSGLKAAQRWILEK